jgi:hypothetical protein
MSLTTAKRSPPSRESSPGNVTLTGSITGSPSATVTPYPTVPSALAPATAAVARPRNSRLLSRSSTGAGASGLESGAPPTEANSFTFSTGATRRRMISPATARGTSSSRRNTSR